MLLGIAVGMAAKEEDPVWLCWFCPEETSIFMCGEREKPNQLVLFLLLSSSLLMDFISLVCLCCCDNF
uniref:Uncharacterized protein n=1 Tax=Rhizophora mucronata TaxID=61149 RepID=A0A2P2Q2M7_RHIMU